MKRFLFFCMPLLATFFVLNSLFAHKGPMDKFGCHLDTLGRRHCHEGEEIEKETEEEKKTEIEEKDSENLEKKSLKEVEEKPDTGLAFFKERLLVEGGLGKGMDFKGEINKSPRNFFDLYPVGPITLLAGDANQIATNYFVKENSPDTEFSSTVFHFGFEYGILNWLGLGISYESEKYDIINGRSELPFYLLFFDKSTPNRIQYELLDSIILENKIGYVTLESLRFNISFHFVRSEKFDAFLSVSLFAGQDKANSIPEIGPGAQAGFRFFFKSKVYFFSTLSHFQYTFVGKGSGHLEEYALKTGFGYAIY